MHPRLVVRAASPVTARTSRTARVARIACAAGLGLVLLPAVGLLGLGCHVDGKVKASANLNAPIEHDDDDVGETFSSAPPSSTGSARALVASTAPPPAPTAPPTEPCSLSCYEARGGAKAELTAEDTAQLRASLEPVFSKMRACTSAEDWRAHGSPFVNVRVASDGSLGELGVEPHPSSSSSCFETAGRNANVSVNLPGRKVVRCMERCPHEAAAGTPARAKHVRPKRHKAAAH